MIIVVYFNNQQMMDLIKNKPTTIEELIKISGFGKVKCEKYGQAILELLNEAIK